MNIRVILLLTVTAGIDASLLNPAFYPRSLYGGFSYSSPYEAIRNYHRARYYARKAYDLARLRAGIYGLGNGFYGYRYGALLSPALAKTPFLGYATPVVPPIASVYPKTYTQVNIPPSLFPVTNSYIPKSYGNAYSQSFSYGKGYNYGKNVFGLGPYLKFPKAYLPPPTFVSPPVPISKMTPILLGSGFKAYSPGYQYSYFVKGPQIPKGIPRGSFKGYDSVYGARYNKFPPRLPVIASKGPLGWNGYPVKGVPVIKDPFSIDPNYGVRFDDYRNQQLISNNREPPWNNFPIASVIGNTGYSLIPPTGPDFALASPQYGLFSDPFNGFAVRSDTNSFKNDAMKENASDDPDLMAHGSRNPFTLESEKEMASTGPDLGLASPHNGIYSDPFKDFDVKTGMNPFKHDMTIEKASNDPDPMMAHESSKSHTHKAEKN